MRFSGVVIRTGVPLPPAAGPVREAMMRQDGVEALRQSMRLYGQCCRSISLTWGLPLQYLPSWQTTSDAVHRRRLHTMEAQRDFLVRMWTQARRRLQDGIRERSRPSPLLTISLSLRRGGWDHSQYTLMANRLPLPPGALRHVDPWHDLETGARNALASAVDAYNFLEDTDLRELAHNHAHHVAALVGGLFGCDIEYSDNTYWDVCPLSLMHYRWGMSAGFTSTRCCSLCGQDIDACEHLLDTRYPVTVRRVDEGTCNACGYHSCSHIGGETVMVYPRPILSEGQLHEVSLVSRPRDPLARFAKFEIDPQMLIQGLGQHPAGRDLRCYRCLHPCGGFTTLPNRAKQSRNPPGQALDTFSWTA
ncbi:hypothetical protein [Streptomyces demainii]|nr:hypothetical protein [Streptomyces demainii]